MLPAAHKWALLTILKRYSMRCCIAFDTFRAYRHEWFVLYSSHPKMVLRPTIS